MTRCIIIKKSPWKGTKGPSEGRTSKDSNSMLRFEGTQAFCNLNP